MRSSDDGRVRRAPPRAWMPVLLAAVLLGAGCTSLSLSNVGAIWHAARSGGDAMPDAAQVAASPHYQLQATGAEGSATLILGNIEGTREIWYGAPPTMLFLEHGRIVKTAGLTHDLDALRLPDDDPFARGLHRLADPVTYLREEDWSPGYRYGVQVEAQLRPAGSETVEILGVSRRLLRIDEHLRAPAAGYAAVNRYWVDPGDGLVWMSEQHIAPGHAIRLTALRPYRGAAR